MFASIPVEFLVSDFYTAQACCGAQLEGIHCLGTINRKPSPLTQQRVGLQHVQEAARCSTLGKEFDRPLVTAWVRRNAAWRKTARLTFAVLAEVKDNASHYKRGTTWAERKPAELQQWHSQQPQREIKVRQGKPAAIAASGSNSCSMLSGGRPSRLPSKWDALHAAGGWEQQGCRRRGAPPYCRIGDRGGGARAVPRRQRLAPYPSRRSH